MKFGEIRMPFGSYKGKTLESIYSTDQKYLLWARDELRGPIAKQIEEFIREKNREIINKGKRDVVKVIDTVPF